MAVVVLLWAPATAQADTYCVGVEAAGCDHRRPTVAAAFEDAAAAGAADTIRIGRVTATGDFVDAAGQPVRVVGAGRGATVLHGTLDLGEPASSAAQLSAGALDLAGAARDVELDGELRLRSGSALLSSVVRGPVVAARARMDGVAVTGTVEVESGALAARHLTVFGAGPVGVRVAEGASAAVTNTVVWGFERAFEGDAAVSHSYAADPGFVAPPGDLRPRADSPLVDAGDPAPLSSGEPHEDALGEVRAMDGDADGTARRDIGAFERRPPAPPGTSGNLLSNPGAEQGEAARDDRAGPAPPGWRRTGGFTSVRYGTMAGDVPFPSLRAAAALAAGDAFFAGGPAGAASLTQVADLSQWAPEIDAGTGAIRLSALLGGYRESPDAAVVGAVFRGPRRRPVGSLDLAPVTPAHRANATMLAPRAASAAIPPLTRTVAVTVRAGRPGGAYNDAYADDVALVPALAPLPGVPPPRAVRRRFAGALVLSRRAGVDRRRRAWVRLGCADATAGRCSGVVTIVRRGTIIGSKRFGLRPGRMGRVGVRLSRRVRGRLRARLYTTVRDGRGVTRNRTAPVRLVRARD